MQILWWKKNLKLIFLFSRVIIVFIIFSIIIIILGFIFRIKLVFNREKIRPFECGFTPKFNARIPFSIRFFLISLVFLIFDVELVLLFPFISSIIINISYFIILYILFFFIILLLGLFHELNQGSLDWVV